MIAGSDFCLLAGVGAKSSVFPALRSFRQSEFEGTENGSVAIETRACVKWKSGRK
jgi:hypothetical protein